MKIPSSVYVISSLGALVGAIALSWHLQKDPTESDIAEIGLVSEKTTSLKCYFNNDVVVDLAPANVRFVSHDPIAIYAFEQDTSQYQAAHEQLPPSIISNVDGCIFDVRWTNSDLSQAETSAPIKTTITDTDGTELLSGGFSETELSELFLFQTLTLKSASGTKLREVQTIGLPTFSTKQSAPAATP